MLKWSTLPGIVYNKGHYYSHVLRKACRIAEIVTHQIVSRELRIVTLGSLARKAYKELFHQDISGQIENHDLDSRNGACATPSTGI